MSCSELACSYAALILHDDGIPITSEKIATLLKAANVNVESYWPGLFVELAEKENIDDLILNVGKALLAPFLDAGGDKQQVPLTEHLNISFSFISEILSWLPVESLLRFKCASKQWFSLIDQDSNFIKIQSVRGSHSVLLYYQTRPDLSYLVPISTEDWKHLAFSGGLCLEQRVNSPLVARIRNPATHQVLYLPEAPKDTVDFSFACNPFSGQCKVVCTYNFRKENDSSRFGEGGVRFEVLTVGKDEQWRGMKHPNQDLEVGDQKRVCVPFNVCQSGGVVHISEIVADENAACVEIYHLDVLSESFTVTSLKEEGVFPDVIDLTYFIWDELLAVSEVRDVDIIVLVLEDFKQHKWSEPKIIPLDFLKNGLALKNYIFPQMSRSMELVFYDDDGGSFFLHDMESNNSQIIELEQVMAERLAPLKSSLVFIDGMKPE